MYFLIHVILHCDASRAVIMVLQVVHITSRGILIVPVFLQTDPDPLVLTMISRPYINLALDSLTNEPQEHILLQHPGADEVLTPETEAVRRAGQEFLRNCIFPNRRVDCNWPKAGIHAKWKEVDVEANQIYGISSQEHLFNLLDYGQLNGGYIPRVTQMRGGCPFHAICKSIKCPREFTNTHLRHMLVLFMIENFKSIMASAPCMYFEQFWPS